MFHFSIWFPHLLSFLRELNRFHLHLFIFFCSYKYSLYTYSSLPMHIYLNLLSQLEYYQKLLCEGKPDFWSRYMLRLLPFILVCLILGNSAGSNDNTSQLHSSNRVWLFYCSVIFATEQKFQAVAMKWEVLFSNKTKPSQSTPFIITNRSKAA